MNKEHPILFNPEMVRAILDGRKTQTRRIIKPQPSGGIIIPDHLIMDCPFGKVGDRLWVRETFASPKKWFVAYGADGECGAFMDDGGGGMFFNHHGWILKKSQNKGTYYGLGKWGKRWRPSIFMPKWAARIWLEITGIRVERVQDISAEDAKAEGIDWGYIKPFPAKKHQTTLANYWELKDEIINKRFRPLWDSLNAKRGFGWSENPWVWVISFKRIEANK